jgi:hypothetical protein
MHYACSSQCVLEGGLQSEESQKVGWLQSCVREGSRGHKKKMARFLTGLFTIFSGLEAWVIDYWGAAEERGVILMHLRL